MLDDLLSHFLVVGWGVDQLCSVHFLGTTYKKTGMRATGIAKFRNTLNKFSHLAGLWLLLGRLLLLLPMGAFFQDTPET
jgi:hypothetical protein